LLKGFTAGGAVPSLSRQKKGASPYDMYAAGASNRRSRSVLHRHPICCDGYSSRRGCPGDITHRCYRPEVSIMRINACVPSRHTRCHERRARGPTLLLLLMLMLLSQQKIKIVKPTVCLDWGNTQSDMTQPLSIRAVTCRSQTSFSPSAVPVGGRRSVVSRKQSCTV
jgi:hypothetical protein